MKSKNHPGEDLFEIVINETFKDKEILLQRNLVGICTDMGKNMLSKTKGLSNRLSQKYKQAISTYDLSQAFNLITQYSLEKFPKEILELIKNICKHFRGSGLRRAQFQNLQIKMGKKESEVRQILNYSEKKWTSLLTASQRIRELWSYLILYYQEIEDDDMISQLNNQAEKYVGLLVCLLQKLNVHIVYFEKDSRDYSSIMTKLQETFFLTAELILKEEHKAEVNNSEAFSFLYSIPYDEPEKVKPYLKDLKSFEERFGAKYQEFYELNIENLDSKVFFKVAMDFILETI